jgi:hypothetical protein
MPEESGFFVGQVGAQIRLETNDDAAILATATTLEIHYQRPESGDTGAWAATLDGTELVYTTISASDLPEAGVYKVQSHTEGPGWITPGKIATMYVREPL